MGRYFGLVNVTKKHKVSSYWKGSPPSINEMNDIIKLFNWNKNDKIYSSSYEDYLIFKGNHWIDGEFYEESFDEDSFEESKEDSFEEQKEIPSSSSEEDFEENSSKKVSEEVSVKNSDGENSDEDNWKKDGIYYDESGKINKCEFSGIFFCN